MLDQRLGCRIDFTITTSRLLRGGTKYKAILKIQLKQCSQEAFLSGFYVLVQLICGLEIVLYIVSFFMSFMFFLSVVRETLVLLHFTAAFLQGQTVLINGEEKEEDGC